MWLALESLPPGDQLHSSRGEEADTTGAKAIIWGVNERGMRGEQDSHSQQTAALLTFQAKMLVFSHSFPSD